MGVKKESSKRIFLVFTYIIGILCCSTNQEIDRQALDLEFGQLVEEIDQISQQTTFNDMELFTGKLGAGNTVFTGLGKAASGADAGEKFAGLANTTVISHTGVSAEASAVSFKQGTYDADADTWTDGAADGNRHVKITYTAANGDVRSEIIDLTKAMTDEDGTAIGTGATVKGKTYNINLGSLGTYKVSISAAATVADVSTTKIATGIAAITGKSVAAGTGAGGNLKIQVGAKKGETMEIGIEKMDATTLGVKSLDINSQASAGTAIETVRAAVNTVSSQRARLGAAQNRLEHKIANLDTSAENLSAAESRIRDVDLASEMTNFTKNNILSQAATAMLAQANTIPQNVLQLLR